MLKVIISEYDNYKKAAQKIVDAANSQHIHSKIVNVEDNSMTFAPEDIVYFLYNGNKIETIFQKAIEKNSTVINNKYFNRKLTKLDSQKELNKFGVKVPDIIETNAIKEDYFPLYFKCKIHGGLCFSVNNMSLWEKIKNDDSFNKDDYYLEKAIVGKNGLINEKKYFM